MHTILFIYFPPCFLQAFFENKPLEKTKKDPKRLSVERIYQKKTQLEHILLRPDSYIGSVEPVTQVRSHTAFVNMHVCIINYCSF